MGHVIVLRNAFWKDFVICMGYFLREFIFEKKAECMFICVCVQRVCVKEQFDLQAISGEPFTGRA